ncbi:MAG: MBL fold metallo-hydrolase [Ruminococcaceae bacterium]|nr:MBL fold metallo-hydrolase [Oscillospiraceae bacterium]
MKLQFLGTGAADWNAEFDSENPEYRRNSSALVDGVLLIDPGPCVPDAIEKMGIEVTGIKYVINTHKHPDHFDEQTLSWLTQNGAEYIECTEGEPVTLGEYEIIPLKGHHRVPTLHYLISDGKSRLFYGLDSAWLLYDEVAAIIKHPVDLAVFDATIGFVEGDYRIFEHSNLRMVLEMKATLAPYIKRFCISHMAKTLHTGHQELADTMAKHDVVTAFDGLEVEF